MDEPANTLTCTPDRRYTALAAASAAVALVLAGVVDDLPGRLLACIAAIVLAAYAVSDLVYSPRLVVSAGGVAVHSPFARFAIGWEQVESIRPDVRTRFGLRATTLEIDGGEVLAVLSRRALGADPQEVAELAAALRPR